MSNICENLLTKAQAHHKKGDLKLAQKQYRQIIALEPRHPIALNNLATILIENGDPHAALALLELALEASPGYADGLSNLAICHGMLNDWDNCLNLSIKALSLQPDLISPWLWRSRAEAALGNIDSACHHLEEALLKVASVNIGTIAGDYLKLCSGIGQRDRAAKRLIGLYPNQCEPTKRSILRVLNEGASREARTDLFERCITKAVSMNQNDPFLRYWQAKQSLREGKEKQAILEFMQVVQNAPSHDEAWLELGLILKKQNNLFKAIACTKRAISENPNNKAAWQELIGCLLVNKECREAVRQSSLARKRFSEDPNILLSHCHALLDVGKPRLAQSILDRFLDTSPHTQDPSLLNCKGLALIQQGLYSDAVRIFRQATRSSPADAGIWNNRGMAYGLAGRSRPETSCYKRAIACNPSDPGSHVNLAMALLARHDFARGLEEYEWRLRSNGGSLNVPVQGRVFNNKDEEPTELLVVCEQGLGDTFHFCRYLYDLRHRLPKTKLFLACPEKLKSILSSSFNDIATVIGEDPAYISRCEQPYLPLMSLPYFCGIHPHRSRAPGYYLRIENKIAHKARMIVRDNVRGKGPVIGVNWKGNPETERSNLKGRSMTLEQMNILANAIPTAVFVSLQKGHGSEELDNCSFRDRFIESQEIITRELCFSYTAGICMACDYVVTTDTSLAHLAGAVGQTTKVLLTAKPEWRWRCTSSKSPWYVNAEYFYQRTPGHWLKPIQEVAESIMGGGLPS
jgi:tetratricopeptide (TPR) repeat protein